MSRIIICNSKKIYIDDYKSVIHISNKNIIIKCKNKILNITGDNLKISDYTKNRMTIDGIICNINWQE